MKIDYSPRAQIDLQNIFSYLNDRNPRAAIEVVREIRDRSESLLVFPLKGVRTNLSGTRRLEIGRYPYFVFYRVANDTISILHIRHTSRRHWQDRD
jgi:addiction module RelE/StbE family toxin